VDRSHADRDRQALIHSQVIHATPRFGLVRFPGGRNAAFSQTTQGWVTCAEPGPRATVAGCSGVSRRRWTDGLFFAGIYLYRSG
jgi:hypothetical protein